ncbi:hypothetical protein OS493_031899, partial [Desmophyllum pertusum]
ANVAGYHMFNFASLQVLVFVAVKEKACNLLSAFLKSSTVLRVFQHCKHELVSFMRKYVIPKGDRQTDISVSVLEMCKK